MTKTLALLAALAVPAAAAAPTLEAAKAAPMLSAELALPARAAFKAQRNVSLRGDVRLSGNAFVPQNGGFVSVPLSGQVRVTGDGGKIRGDAYVNEYASVWVREGTNYVSQHVSVNVSVSLYEGGRYVGTAYVNGSVWVNGWANGSWLRLDGNGSVSGSAFVRDAEKKD